MDIAILAAGQGKRMYSDLPKVLHPLAGKPLLAHVLDTARQLKPKRLVVVYGHGGEQVREQLDSDDIVWVKQAEQLGTGHAVQQALPHITEASDDSDPLLLLYGDVPLITEQSLLKLLAQADGGALAIMTVELADPGGYGRIVRDAYGRVSAIVEQKDASLQQQKICEINTGIMAIPKAPLAQWLDELRNDNAQGEYYLTDIVGQAVASGRGVLTEKPDHSHEVEGVNDQLQLAKLERIWQQRFASQLLQQGVRLADPARIDIRAQLSCGRDVTIDVGCVFSGAVELGDNVTIGPYCVLQDVTVGSGARIEAFSHIVGASIGERAVVGPYARLRPGTVLASAAHVGNFVEIKASHIGDASKANHLSYIGDADVGKRVNIGAGAITCNYDGANKHRSIIEDDAFIGSDSQLVAPVKVGKGATIGAGTTLTGDAPANELTTSRIRQRSFPDWQRPQKKDAKN